MPFFDDKNKKVTWATRNYFFLGTLIFVALNILLFVCFGNSWEDSYGNISDVWSKPFEFGNLIRSIFNCMSHSDWEHVLFNMLFFAIAAIYIERKMGTLTFILFVCGAVILDASITTATDLALNWHGWSGMVFITQFYVFIDYIFSFQKQKRNKFNIIFGAIVCFISYASMSATIDGGKLIIYGYPVGLIYNAGHYSAALAGTILALTIHISQLKIAKQMQYIELEKPTNTLANKITYICVAVLIALFSTGTTLAALSANNRSNIMCSITFDSSVNTFDKKFDKKFQDSKNLTYDYIFREWLSSIDATERVKYAYEFYFDKDYTKPFGKKYNTKNSFYNMPWGRGEFVPLATALDQTIYVKTYEIYIIKFANYDAYFNSSFAESLKKENLRWAYDYMVGQIPIEKNTAFKFKLTGSFYQEENIVLSIGGVEMQKDEEGYYIIENISSNIEIDVAVRV